MALFFVALLAVLALVVPQVSAVAYEFPINRLLQYDEGPSKLGSRAAALNLQAIVGDQSGNSTLNRRVAVLKLQDATVGKLESLIDDNKIGGLLLLLPTGSGASPDQYLEVQNYLLRREIRIPVYFTPLTDKLAEIYSTISHSQSAVNAQDNYQLVATASEAKAVTPTLTNFQGWLSGMEDEDGDAPTLAIVASYDTFAAAPGLATGGSDGGSGAVALLELARLYSRLYASDRTKGKYNLLFVLTSGSRLNFFGSQQWLGSVDSRLLSSISLALCIDSLAPAADAGADALPPLYLHTSKPEGAKELAAVLPAFRDVASRMGRRFELSHRKINVAQSERQWQHEPFALKRVMAASLSTRQTPATGLAASQLSAADVDAAAPAVESGIRYVAETLAYIIYGHTHTAVFEGEWAVDSNLVRAWLQALATTPRFAPLLESDSPLLKDIDTTLSSWVSDSDKQTFQYESSSLQFFGPLVGSMTAYRVKPITFDVYLSLAVAAYLLLLTLALQGPAALSPKAVMQLLGGAKEARQKFKRA